MGPLKVFEAGEYHTIKGFKVAVCSYQIESRKVLARDNLKVQTAPPPAKPKKTQTYVGSKPTNIQKEGCESSMINTPKSVRQHASYVSGKGSHLDSTIMTRNYGYQENVHSQEIYDSDLFADKTLGGENSIYNTEVSNEKLLQEVMQEIEQLEASTRGRQNIISYPPRGELDGSSCDLMGQVLYPKKKYCQELYHNVNNQDPFYDSFDQYSYEQSMPVSYLPQAGQDTHYQYHGEYYESYGKEDYPISNHHMKKSRKQPGFQKSGWQDQIEAEDSPHLLWNPADQLPPQ